MDAALSLAVPAAMDIHARIERWALDEVALPGKLVNQIVQWLYREDRFCHGILTVLGSTVGPTCMPIPTLAIVNAADEIAPLTSVAPFIGKMPTNDTGIIGTPAKSALACLMWACSSGVLPTHEYGRKSSPGLKCAVESGDLPHETGWAASRVRHLRCLWPPRGRQRRCGA
jgi:hypothetical protein